MLAVFSTLSSKEWESSHVSELDQNVLYTRMIYFPRVWSMILLTFFSSAFVFTVSGSARASQNYVDIFSNNMINIASFTEKEVFNAHQSLKRSAIRGSDDTF